MSDDARARLWRRAPVLIGGGLVLAASVVVVLVWFQPQTLLFDRVVDEDFPIVGQGTADEPVEGATVDESVGSATVVEPVAALTGDFESRSRYTVTGSAVVYDVADGERILRLEDFESTNGPDLFVYLAAADSSHDDAAIDDDFIDLGVLRGNVGTQNYEIPVDVDLDHYDTVVIWCRRFTVGFGAADLGPSKAGS